MDARGNRRAPSERFLPFALGATNTIAFLAIAVLITRARGETPGIPAGMHPVLAVGMLLAFWLLTWWATARGIRGCRHDRSPSWASTWAEGIRHGCVAGLVAVIALFLLVIALALIEEGFTGRAATAVAYFALYVWTVGLVGALIVGAAAGFVLATVDRLVLTLLPAGWSAELR